MRVRARQHIRVYLARGETVEMEPELARSLCAAGLVTIVTTPLAAERIARDLQQRSFCVEIKDLEPRAPRPRGSRKS